MGIFRFCLLFLLLSFIYIYHISVLSFIFVLLLGLIFIGRIFLIIIFVLSIRRIILSKISFNSIFDDDTFYFAFGIPLFCFIANNNSSFNFMFVLNHFDVNDFHTTFVELLRCFILILLLFYIVYLLSS